MITNAYISDLLEEIATWMEIQGENSFKIRAYRMAAATIREWTTSIAKIPEIEELMKIPGIGKSIAEKVREISLTGDCKIHQDFLAEFPKTLLDLLRIEGLGPKRVGLLYKKLGISNASQLKEAALQGKIEELEGFGKKSVNKILEGIERLEERKDRFPLEQVLFLSQNLVATMQQVPGIEKVAVAGSLRRWKETVKDLDILVTGDPKHTEKVMDAFTSYHLVDHVLLRGETKSTVQWKMGIHVDLRFVSPDCFGSSMQYFTGSKEHNISLRTLAKEKGFKTSEYGLFELTGGEEKKIAGADEEEFYRKLGMDYIEPELRENTGEIECALQKTLPKLIQLSDIQGDLQMHTTESDGKNTLEEMIEAARTMGYKYIAITEHSKAVRVANGLDEERLLRWMEKIRKVRERYRDIQVFAGVEVDILKDGSLDLDEKVLSECDVVVASIHSYLRMPAEEMTKRIIAGISRKVVNILAHPTARIIHQREPIEYDFDRVLEAAISNKVALEINSYPSRLDLKDSLVRKVIEKKGWISINTDAHSIEQLKYMEFGIHIARRGWCQAVDCINTFSLDDLWRFLRKASKQEEVPSSIPISKQSKGRKKGKTG